MILADADVVHHGSSTHPTCELTIATAKFRLPFGKRTFVLVEVAQGFDIDLTG